MAYRPLPELNERNRYFWTSGVDGKLRFLRCQDCGYYIHPHGPICPECHSEDLSPEPVSGNAEILSVTINYQNWGAGIDTPYAIAIVGLPEQRGLNLTTNIVGTPWNEIEPGLRVTATFEPHGEIYIPLFRKLAPGT